MMLVALQVLAGFPQPPYAQSDAPSTTTPIKHVIVIIGENRTFDHVYGTYKPKAGETVSNLLSKGIVKEDGTPGPNYSLSAQFSALDGTTSGTDTFSNSPQFKSIYGTLPPALAGGNENASDTNPAPFKTLAVARLADQDVAWNAAYDFVQPRGRAAEPDAEVGGLVEGERELKCALEPGRDIAHRFSLLLSPRQPRSVPLLSRGLGHKT